MRKMALVAIVSIMVVGMPASPAAGGGWWSYADLSPSLVAPGMTVRIRATFLPSDAALEGERSERFYAYLIEDLDRRMVSDAMSKAAPRDWWRLGGAKATKLTPVKVRLRDGGLGRVLAEFEMPRTPSGRYSLMICDDGCIHPLGDFVPTTLSVVQSPLVARLKGRSDRMRGRLFRAKAAARKSRVRSKRTLAEVGALRADISTLRGEMSSLEGRLRRADRDPTQPWGPILWASMGAATATLLAFLARRRRSRAQLADRLSEALTVEDLFGEGSASPKELQRTHSR